MSTGWASGRSSSRFRSLSCSPGLVSAIGRQYTPGGTDAFNLGVDFKGGTVVTAKFREQPGDGRDPRSSCTTPGSAKPIIQDSTDKTDEVLIKVPNLGRARRDAADTSTGKQVPKLAVRGQEGTRYIRHRSRGRDDASDDPDRRLQDRRNRLGRAGRRFAASKSGCHRDTVRSGRHPAVYRFPIRLDVRCRCGHRGVSRRADHACVLFGLPVGDKPDGDRRTADAGRILGQRLDRDLRPYSRKSDAPSRRVALFS